ncbi:MAG TPA: hypothetical protein DIC22_00105 [Chitinophagaceae bacterium]|nr:hypothetical protein [Chitinophagaceae bacterium]
MHPKKTRPMRILLLWIFISAARQTAFCQGAHSTGFKPEAYGLHFVNAFANTFFDQQGIRISVSGCSGGMCYAALDYYNRNMMAPKQSYQPPDNSLLYDYFYSRQLTSLFENTDKWQELTANPFGWQNHEFFNWGLQGTYGGRLQELKSYIDKGIPVPLGLFEIADGRSLPDNQVIAIGYDCGRYQGILGDYMEDVKIYCYNPAYPDMISTLQVNKTRHYYYWKDHEINGDHYAGYFVDTRYVAATPPPDPSSAASQPDCNAQELVVTFKSGDYGLRGGDDNCHVMLQFNDGTVQQFLNVNRSQPWPANTTHTAELWLADPLPLSAFKNIIFYTKSCDGSNGIPCNNWNLNQVTITARGGFPDAIVLTQIGNPLLKRFSGKDFSGTYYFTNLPACTPGNGNVNMEEPETGSATTNQLLINIRTGNDDLQGGDDNLSISVSYRDGTSQTFSNVNAGINWPVNSTNTATINLNKTVRRSDIMRLELRTKNCQEGSCDNWSFQGITVTAKGYNTEQVIYQQSGNPIYLFTGSNNVYSIVLKKN